MTLLEWARGALEAIEHPVLTSEEAEDELHWRKVVALAEVAERLSREPRERTFNRIEECAQCSGTGYRGDEDGHGCPVCLGTGLSQGKIIRMIREAVSE